MVVYNCAMTVFTQKPGMSDSMLPTKQIGQNQHQFDGTIEFQNVHFSYPTRPDVKVIP